ncbi:hypothetical protein CLAIMM_08293 isoform 2 [Cladophialophora immunda]|nr:hypothetical protein CLAIMM_08293 isoform 2 [Cladophialophora immunda]
MSASSNCHGPGAKHSSTSLCTGNGQNKQIKASSSRPVKPLVQYGLRHLEDQYAARRTPTAIDSWESEINEFPSSYERIVYSGNCKNGKPSDVADARLLEQATQINSMRETNDAAIKVVDRDLSFVGAWAETGCHSEARHLNGKNDWKL